MSNTDQHYKYIYTTLICDEYEKGAIKHGVKKMDRAASMVQGLPMLSAMEMAVDSVDTVLVDNLKNLALHTRAPQDPAMMHSQHSENEGFDSGPNQKEMGETMHVEVTGDGLRVKSGKEVLNDPLCDEAGLDVNICSTQGDTEGEFSLPHALSASGEGLNITETPGSKFWRCESWSDEDWDGFDADTMEAATWDIDDEEGWKKDIFGPDSGWTGMNEWFGTQVKGLDMTRREYLEKCFNCTWEGGFNINIPPYNMLGQLEKFLKELEDILDWVINKLNPTSMVKNICLLWDMFKWWCPPTWLLILGMLKSLLSKYMYNSLKLKLDWTAIIGGIIRIMVEWVATFLEQLKALLMVPIDCIRNIALLFDQIYRAGAGVLDQGVTLWDYYGGEDGVLNYSTGSTPLFSGKFFENSTWENFAAPSTGGGGGKIFGMGTEGWLPGSEHDPFRFARGGPGGAPSVGPNKDPNAGTLGMPWQTRGVDIEGQTHGPRAYQEMTKLAAEYNPIQWFIVHINTFKKWIEEFIGRIIETIRSLNALFTGNLKLNLMNMGFIVMLLDFIALILAVIALQVTWECEDGEAELTDEVERIQRWVDIMNEECAALGYGEDPEAEFGSTSASLIFKSKSGLYESRIDLHECASFRGAIDPSAEQQWEAMQEAFDFSQFGFQGIPSSHDKEG